MMHLSYDYVTKELAEKFEDPRREFLAGFCLDEIRRGVARP